MKNNKIVVIGSSNTDMSVKSAKLPSAGETVLGGTFKMFHGGKGANQAVAASRCGGNTTLIAKVGNDAFGKQAIDNYKTNNINTDNIIIDEKSASGVALIMVDENGENCISVASGANSNLRIEDIQNLEKVIKEASIVLMQLEIPLVTVEYVARIAAENGVKVVLNPAPMKNISKKIISYLYAIVPNKNEAELLSGIKISNKESAKDAADKISSMGVKIVVITLGAEGALVKEDNKYYYVPAMKVKAVDTTGAGDTFCGVFTVGLSDGQSVKNAVEMASKAAGISVTKEGAQDSIPYRKEFDINCLI